jgi:hypothetical protein
MTSTAAQGTGLPINDSSSPTPFPPDAVAIAIVGSAGAAAREALRLAEQWAPRRQVLIFDLLGDSSPLAELASDDDPHGISDAVRYGVSLRSVARPVRRMPRVYVVRGGQEPPFDKDVLTSRAWEVWREQVRRGAGLMLVAMRADIPGTTAFLERLDGVVLSAEVPLPPESIRVLGRFGELQLLPQRPAQRPVHRHSTRPSMATWAAVWATLLAAGALLAMWRLGLGPFAPRSGDRASDAPAGPSGSAATQTRDSTEAGWSVELGSTNSLAAAVRRANELSDSLPAATLGVGVRGSGGTWYRILAGAFGSASDADSLARQLRATMAPATKVVHAPFAWLLEESIPLDSVVLRLSQWRARGLAAYAVARGTQAAIYFGAFESLEEGSSLAPFLDSLGISAILTLRVGSKR